MTWQNADSIGTGEHSLLLAIGVIVLRSKAIEELNILQLQTIVGIIDHILSTDKLQLPAHIMLTKENLC